MMPRTLSLHALALLLLACAGPEGVTGQAAVTPGARVEHAMVYDAARQHVLLLGGGGGSDAAATFAYDGSSWRRVATSGPPPRSSPLLAYDAARRVVVLFGGRNGMTALGDTWEWDGKQWRERTGAGPGARLHAGMAYDAASQRVLLYGGFSGGSDRSDTWAWDGTAWSQLDDAGPPGRSVNSMTESNGRAVLVTVYNAPGTTRDGNMGLELWTWSGSAWQATSPVNVRFSPAVPVTPTAVAGELLLYAGYDAPPATSATTWLVRGSARSLPGAEPGRRRGTAAAFDARRGRVVLYGGESDTAVLADTWEFDGERWRQR